MIPMQILMSGPRLERIREESIARWQEKHAMATDGQKNGAEKQRMLTEKVERVGLADGAPGKTNKKNIKKTIMSGENPRFAPQFDGISIFETIICC